MNTVPMPTEGKISHTQTNTASVHFASEKPNAPSSLWEYLYGASESSAITHETAERAWTAWLHLRRGIGDALSLPDAAMGPGGELLLIWNRGPCHLELEFLPDGAAEFFARHRETGLLWGEDYRADAPLSEAAREQLKAFAQQ